MAGAIQFDRLRVVLVRTRNPLNIGAAARAMSNFGFAHLCAVCPYNPSFREAKSAVGASEVLAHAKQFETLADAIADCSLVVGTTSVGPRDLQQPIKRLDAGAKLICERLAMGRVALLFGSEKIGLTNDDLSHCHWLMHIPTREQHHSMNLGQAVAVCLYELVRGAAADGLPRHGGSVARVAANAASSSREAASAVELERLTSTFVDVLLASGFLKSLTPSGQQKIRRFVRRASLSADDAETLLGMLRQILWKIKNGSD